MLQHDTRTFKERIQDNAIIIVLGIGVATAGTTASVMTYFSAQKEKIITERYNSKIEKLTERVATINRSLDGQQKIDIRKMLRQEAEIQEIASKNNMKYFSEIGYCVSANIEGLRYERTTESALLAKQLGEDVIPKELSTAFSGVQLDLWAGDRVAIENAGPVKFIFPYVGLEQITRKQLVATALAIGKSFGNDENESLTSKTPTARSNADASRAAENADNKADASGKEKEMLDMLTRKTNNDSVAFYLAMQLIALFTSDMDVNVRRIEQVGPVMYMQAVIKIKGVKINGVIHPNYYIIKEYFLLSRGDSVLFIVTQIPTDNPLVGGPASAEINEWLTSFRLAAL